MNCYLGDRYPIVLPLTPNTLQIILRSISLCEYNVITFDEMNLHLATAIVAPMTTKGKLYPSRVPVNFEGKDGLIVLDQIRTVDKTRLVKKLGTIALDEQKAVLSILVEMFSED
jgi:mRNA interferase MazF